MVFLVGGRGAENIEGKIKTDRTKTLINEDKNPEEYKESQITTIIDNRVDTLLFFDFVLSAFSHFSIMEQKSFSVSSLNLHIRIQAPKFSWDSLFLNFVQINSSGWMYARLWQSMVE